MPKGEAFTFLNMLSGLGYLVVSNDKKMIMNETFKSLTQGLEIVETEGSASLKTLLYLP
jgi:hypothetical protein